jgi:2-phospho-L-lactate transferase/gluconeogenesis factor (CofD/UPF0052 family)
MTLKEVLKDIMDKQGVGIAMLGRRMGVSMIKANNRLSQGNMSVRILSEFCKALDYKVVLMPVSKKTPSECYDITFKDEGEQE